MTFLVFNHALSLSAKIWWPLFPLLLLIVVVALSAGVVLAFRGTATRKDMVFQCLALLCYLFTAIVAMASERGAVSANFHRLPSIFTQMVLCVQLVRVWNRQHARGLRTLNIVAWGAILADTALHYLMKPGS
ncbi:MAG: hypothetical protein E6K60_04410 [Nitrospirae bacterium]|nr:MAG: hypothetical protein E6K60_04410 [Nitrospirota bacterium]